MDNNDMSNEDGKTVDWFLKCTAIGRELNKHERKYNDMIGTDATPEDIERQLVIVNRLKGLNEEVCVNAEK
jgi:hypothetical protein